MDLVVAAYIFSDDKVLLIHHRKLDNWIPVGGHIEKGEAPDDAVKREAMEETGLDVEILNKSDITVEGKTKKNLATPFHVNIHSVGDHDHCCLYYVCRARDPEKMKINKELKNAKWFSKDDLNDKIIPVDVKNQALKAFELYESGK